MTDTRLWRVRVLNPRTGFPVIVLESGELVCMHICMNIVNADITAYLDVYDADKEEWRNHLRYEP